MKETTQRRATIIFQWPNILTEINKRILVWAGHAWVIRGFVDYKCNWRRPKREENLGGRDWGGINYCVKRDLKIGDPNIQWMVEDRWQYIYLVVWS